MSILDLVFPKSCIGCGKGERYLCPDCVAKVALQKAICPYCKHPSIDGATHINCQRKLGIDGLTSIWRFEGIIRSAVLSLKYKYATNIGTELSEYVISSLRLLVFPSVHYLTPVPIYWYRQNTRGFNQSYELGKFVADAMGFIFIPNLLTKVKSTISQVELSAEERRKNLKGVFCVNPGIEIPESVFLFDDVFTTGSTMFEAGKILKRSGVKKVWGLTIAR